MMKRAGINFYYYFDFYPAIFKIEEQPFAVKVYQLKSYEKQPLILTKLGQSPHSIRDRLTHLLKYAELEAYLE